MRPEGKRKAKGNLGGKSARSGGQLSLNFSESPEKKVKAGKISKSTAYRPKAAKKSTSDGKSKPRGGKPASAALLFDPSVLFSKIKRLPKASALVGSRVRLARNLAGRRFLKSASPEEKREIFLAVRAALLKISEFKGGLFYRRGDMSESEIGELVESGVASSEFLSADENCGICVSKDGIVRVLINEEDHIRIQAVSGDLSLSALLKRAFRVDDSLEKSLEYAFDSKLGYLTACPTNVGTGLRASSMLHLPALVLSGNMEKVVRGLNQLGAIVRGSSGEGSDPIGSFFQISNQITLGISEEDLVKKIESLTEKLIGFERNARGKILEDTPLLIADKILRAEAILRSCALISSAEAMEMLSMLRLAADIGCVVGRNAVEKIDFLMKECMPLRLAKRFSSDLSNVQLRDAMRAKFLNGVFSSGALNRKSS